MPSFRVWFRSPSRDKQTDLRRVEAVRKAVQSAIESARSELEGVSRRMEGARQECAHLFGDEIQQGHREPNEEALLREVEQRLMSASQRVPQLTQHINDLHKIETFLDATFSK